MTTSYGYDKDSRLTGGIATRNSSQEVLDSYIYTHDKVGNRLSKASPEAKDSYAYDAVYKLLQSLPTKLQGKDKEQEPVGDVLFYFSIQGQNTSNAMIYSQLEK